MSMDHGVESVEMGQKGNFFVIAFCQKKFFSCCLLSKEMVYGDGTVGNFFLVVFCDKFFMEMGQ